MKTLSISALAKQHNIQAKDLFLKFENLGMISRENEQWILTKLGEASGGSYKDSKKFGKYITWPEDLKLPIESNVNPSKEVPSQNSTAIGKHFNLSSRKLNAIFSELGWIKKSLKGWIITPQGEAQGGKQKEHPQSGVPYVIWRESITQNKSLTETIKDFTGSNEEPVPNLSDNGYAQQGIDKNPQSVGFREKFPATHRATDGHMVRSKAETLIDNWLYMAEIVHAYERKLPIEEEVYCDFYIPTGKVYIEYWGYEHDSKYLDRKEIKKNIYKKYGFNLIELDDEQVQNLDDILPRLLLKYGIQAY
ncbi:hypothetical protein OAB00_03120 [Akkermansiaceae bacterium]|nr:hypothetical protein [Akkermansiaceae bacterium]